jgi:hypothetical protein
VLTAAAARTALAVGGAALEAAAAACRDAASLPNVHHLVGLASAPVASAASEQPSPLRPQLPPADQVPGADDDEDDSNNEGGAVSVDAEAETAAGEGEGETEEDAAAVETVTRLSDAAATAAVTRSGGGGIGGDTGVKRRSLASSATAENVALTAAEARTAWRREALAEGMMRLEELPDERVLLHWANYHVVRDAAAGGTPGAQRALTATQKHDSVAAAARERWVSRRRREHISPLRRRGGGGGGGGKSGGESGGESGGAAILRGARAIARGARRSGEDGAGGGEARL